MYHEIDAKIHHWFIPARTLWQDFPEFITGGPDGLDNTTPPYIDMPAVTGAAIGSLADYLGVPTGVPNLRVSALPFRAYAHVWNEYYRDQDLQAPLLVSDGNGADTTTSTALQFGCWEKDYFTSARPSPQKGPSVSIPLTGNAPVRGIGFTQPLGTAPAAQSNVFESGDTGATVRSYGNAVYGSNTNQMNLLRIKTASGSTTQPHPDISADLTDISAVVS